MLIHLGTEDLRVPNSQGMSLYHMLKARNVETKLVNLYSIIFCPHFLYKLLSCLHGTSMSRVKGRVSPNIFCIIMLIFTVIL